MAVYRTWSVYPAVMEAGSCNHDHADRSSSSKPVARTDSRVIPVTVHEAENAWIVEADVPGATADRLNVEFFQGRLTVRYERKPADNASPKFDDRVYGTFERVIRIADEVQTDGIAAKLEHGTLRLEIQKSEAARPKTVPVIQG